MGDETVTVLHVHISRGFRFDITLGMIVVDRYTVTLKRGFTWCYV